MKRDLQAFWLAASDISCVKKFVWCSGTQVAVANYDWVKTQPVYTLNQNCLAQYLEKGIIQDVGLKHLECTNSHRYFCEEV